MSRRNFSQPSLADAFVNAYSRVGGFLEDIAKTFEWAAFGVLMGRLHSSSDGAPAYPPLTMFKIVLLEQWYGLSDPGAEEAVRDRLSFRRFCGIPLDQETPDHSSIWRFRQRIEKLGLSEKLLAEVNRQLDARDLIVKRGTLVDATIIAAAVKPPSFEEGVVSERKHNKPLVNWQVWFNKTASRIRVGVERANATMKNWYGMAKVRYLGLDRNNCHLQFVAMAMNMKRARLLIAAPCR